MSIIGRVSIGIDGVLISEERFPGAAGAPRLRRHRVGTTRASELSNGAGADAVRARLGLADVVSLW
jgi:hypothetical protein